MIVSRSIRVVGPLALVIAFVCPVLGQKPRVVRTNETDRRIEAALNQETELQFIDARLSDVILYLYDRHGVQFVIDGKSIREQSASSGTDELTEPGGVTVTADVAGMSLRSGLNHVLGQLDIAWTVRDEAIVVTTPEHTECLLVYDIRGLLQNAANLDETLRAAFPEVKIIVHGRSLVVNARQSQHEKLLQLLRQLFAQEPQSVQEIQPDEAVATEIR